MTDAKVPTETERVMPDSRPAVLALPTDAAIANRDAVSSLTPASHSDFSRRSGNTAQPETDDTSDMDDERDDSPYCDCGAIPGEEEEAANRCDCCGKRIEPRSAPCREVHMSQYTDHDREQLEQWLDAYCNQDGTERVLTGKILDYIAATNERLRSPGGARELPDMVPRSRYDAANKDWLDEKAAREAMLSKSVAWIETLLAALRSAEARLNQPVLNNTESAGNQAANILRADIKSALSVIRTALKYEPSGSAPTPRAALNELHQIDREIFFPEPSAEPVAWYHNGFGVLELSRIRRVGWKPLYAHPSPEPSESPAAAGAAFAAEFKREPTSPSDCAWMNGYAAGRRSPEPAGEFCPKCGNEGPPCACQEKPLADDEGIVAVVAQALCLKDGGDPHRLIWTGYDPPEPWGDEWCRYEDEAKGYLRELDRQRADYLARSSTTKDDKP